VTDIDTHPPSPGVAAGTDGADPRVLAMARAFDRTRRRVEGLDTRVAQLAADITRMAGVLTAQRPPHSGDLPDSDPPEDDTDPDDGTAVRSWLLGAAPDVADPDQAVADVTDLIGWLHRVYLRYPGSELSACWLWHPHVIEELWWLRNAHADAYHPADGSWLRVGDWHDRQRPAVAKRVREAIGSCDLSLHAPGKPHGQPAPVAPLTAHAAAIAAAWAAGGARPEPTAEQLSEGAAYFAALYRTQR
jgi:hypothetical protein